MIKDSRMNSITVQSIDKAEVYSRISLRILNHARVCSLVVRSRLALSEEEKAFLKMAGMNLLQKVEMSGWLGTRLLRGTATLYHLSLNLSFTQLFVDSGADLTAWLHRDLPEDPTFYRSDGTLIMESASPARQTHSWNCRIKNYASSPTC
jgi:hypothetical protein